MILTTDLDMVLREQTALIDKQQVFILCDDNTAKHCLPTVQATLQVPAEHIMTIPAGEEHKTLATVEKVWQFLLAQGATRHSMLINLGGGVITDLGGFVAATYMRGMQFLHIPTTLLGMIDASAGGKTGFDYQGIKNIIGVFRMPKETIIYTEFLNTLPAEQFLSGFAEMVKHALISSPLELASILAFDLHGYIAKPTNEAICDLITRSIDIKNYIVESDPEETGMRQTLNFGHTIGHALESLSYSKFLKGEHTEKPMLHGYAVMYGMISELYLCVMKQGFPEKDLQKIVALMKEYYGKPVCPCREIDELIAMMKHDKKNPSSEQITFTMLRTVGNYRLGCTCTEAEIKEALDFLFNS